jgi:hypothetical protein
MEKNINKTASTLVVIFIRAINYKMQGTTSLAVCNYYCHIEEYFTWSHTSQYNKCQEYGHHPYLTRSHNLYALSVHRPIPPKTTPT